MANLFRSWFIENNCNDIEAQGAIIDFVFGKKDSGCLFHTGFFGEGNYVLGRGEVLVFTGFDFDEDDGTVGIGHNEVDFTLAAAEVAVEVFEAFVFKVRQTLFLAPEAASSAVERCGFSFENIGKHLFGLYRGMFAVPL